MSVLCTVTAVNHMVLYTCKVLRGIVSILTAHAKQFPVLTLWHDGCVLTLWSFYRVCIYHIIMVYTENEYRSICQLSLRKVIFSESRIKLVQEKAGKVPWQAMKALSHPGSTCHRSHYWYFYTKSLNTEKSPEWKRGLATGAECSNSKNSPEWWKMDKEKK